MAAPTGPKPLRFKGSKHLISRLVLATLTGRTIVVSDIRTSNASAPGINADEMSFLRLLEAVTNGGEAAVGHTGTRIAYEPGLITGSAAGHGSSGGVIRHNIEAGCSRGASFYLIPLCLLAPFSKAKMNVLLTGPGVITSATPTGDVSVDTVRTAILPIFKSFGIERDLELRVLKRSNPGPGGVGGGGEVQLVFGHQVRLPKTIHLLDAGRIRRIQGVAYATGVAGANNARTIHAAKGVLNEFVPDTRIHSDVSSAPLIAAPERNNANAKKKIGLGFGLSLVAESNTGALYSADVASDSNGGEVPEDLGKRCAYQLLESIAQGGFVSNVAAPTVLTMMAMGSEDVGRLAIGKEVLGTEQVVQLARDLRAFGMNAWGIKDSDEEGEALVSIIGRGVGNVGRKIA